MKRPKLTDTDIAHAYAKAAIYAQPVMLRVDGTEKAARRAIIQAVCRGHVEHSGDPERGWLTEAGIDLLEPEIQEQYRAAVRGKTLMRAG